MPIKIKKKQLPKQERVSCGLGITAMLFAIGLASVLILFVQQAEDSEPKALGVAAFAVYAALSVVCLIHLIHGLYVFKKLESYGAVFTAMFTAVSLLGMLLNLQFMLAMLFSSVGADKLLDKVLGDASLSDFMSSQSSAWSFMICGISTAFAVGIIDTIRLSRRK